jgi:hypothetical protein
MISIAFGPRFVAESVTNLRSLHIRNSQISPQFDRFI